MTISQASVATDSLLASLIKKKFFLNHIKWLSVQELLPKTYHRTGPPSESCARRKSPLGCQFLNHACSTTVHTRKWVLCALSPQNSAPNSSPRNCSLRQDLCSAALLPAGEPGKSSCGALQLLQHRRPVTWRVCSVSQAEAGPHLHHCHLRKC